MSSYNFSDYRCPRWNELPDLGLYMDQVLIVVENALRPLFPYDSVVLTSTMVNNYVKQQVLAPSEKKKYRREHLASLITITVLKRVLSVAEIRLVLDRLAQSGTAEDNYNLFCTQLEQRLQGKPGEKSCDPILAAAVDAVAGKLIFESKCLPLPEPSGSKKSKEQGRD